MSCLLLLPTRFAGRSVDTHVLIAFKTSLPPRDESQNEMNNIKVLCVEPGDGIDICYHFLYFPNKNTY